MKKQWWEDEEEEKAAKGDARSAMKISTLIKLSHLW